MTDLERHIPKDYFTLRDERLSVSSEFQSAKSLESELQWGYKASILGKDLYFSNSVIMTARERSASEVLMHLGMLAATEAYKTMAEEIANTVAKGKNDGNAGAVAKQLKNSHIPTFHKNLKGGLSQYLKHLDRDERAPFVQLLPHSYLLPLRRLFDWLVKDLAVKVIIPVLVALILLFLGLK